VPGMIMVRHGPTVWTAGTRQERTTPARTRRTRSRWSVCDARERRAFSSEVPLAFDPRMPITRAPRSGIRTSSRPRPRHINERRCPMLPPRGHREHGRRTLDATPSSKTFAARIPLSFQPA
jgi:hypothetical protein